MMNLLLYFSLPRFPSFPTFLVFSGFWDEHHVCLTHYLPRWACLAPLPTPFLFVHLNSIYLQSLDSFISTVGIPSLMIVQLWSRIFQHIHVSHLLTNLFYCLTPEHFGHCLWYLSNQIFSFWWPGTVFFSSSTEPDIQWVCNVTDHWNCKRLLIYKWGFSLWLTSLIPVFLKMEMWSSNNVTFSENLISYYFC